MQMTALFAAGLYDNPWVIVAIFIFGALINWLSKRRQEKQAGHPVEGDEPSPSSGKPQETFSLEETLRRLMGEEPPAPVPAPPTIPGAADRDLSPVEDWQEEEPFQPTRETVRALRPPPIVGQPSIITTAASEQLEQAARRFEQLNDQGRHPATVVRHWRRNSSGAARQTASRWRDRRSARQAFIGSIVFGPPKSLEP
jgi:hypothetical protein